MAKPPAAAKPKKSLPPAAEVTTDQPKDPAWDGVRQTWGQLGALGRMMLRGQVRLGMQLAALKKVHGVRRGPKAISPDSGQIESWADTVKRETGFSRQSADVFIQLAEATRAKLAKTKKLNLPAPAKKDALALFHAENPLALTDEQWSKVDLVVGTLTNGQTQAGLLEELGVVAKPRLMPKGVKGGDGGTSVEQTAGQLAFHFFGAVASPLINARTNPEYKALLRALPVESTTDQPLSLRTMEAEFRAALADIEEVMTSTARQAKGRAVS